MEIRRTPLLTTWPAPESGARVQMGTRVAKLRRNGTDIAVLFLFYFTLLDYISPVYFALAICHDRGSGEEIVGGGLVERKTLFWV